MILARIVTMQKVYQQTRGPLSCGEVCSRVPSLQQFMKQNELVAWLVEHPKSISAKGKGQKRTEEKNH